MKLPDGFEEYKSGVIIIRMNVALYVTKQVAYYFFKTLTKHVKKMAHKQSKADPCQNFA